MIKRALLLAGLLITLISFSQQNEFPVYANGLIYSEPTMKRLSLIVDSLNLKFKSCELNTKYHSAQQAIGHLVRMKNGNIIAAKNDMENQLPLEDFLKKYPDASIERFVLIIRSLYANYQGKETVEIRHFDLEHDYGFSITSNDLELYKKDLQNQWLFTYNQKVSYTTESLTAFYFPANFSSHEIPHKYAMMIGYADCLIDTTTPKFKDNLKRGRVSLPSGWASLSQQDKVILLEKMRSTRVVGMCSMDNSPREHAVNIALLSAETFNWEVFLKSHLDIMNDRFERYSDGSYAWGKRNTYIRELEVLRIDVADLVLGTVFRIGNPAKNHYYGSIGRLGRALSETRNRAEIESTILSIIIDKELDDYNRLLFYFLFLNYNHYIQDKKLQEENKRKLLVAVEKLPDYIKIQLKQKIKR